VQTKSLHDGFNQVGRNRSSSSWPELTVKAHRRVQYLLLILTFLKLESHLNSDRLATHVEPCFNGLTVTLF
jgi:hypothetical protein